MGQEMREQLFVKRSEPTEERFAAHKKTWRKWNGFPAPFSGMWTSTFIDKELGSSWVQCCLRGGGAGAWIRYATQWQSWKLVVDKSARVYHLDSEEALNKLLTDYPYFGSPYVSGPSQYPDWNKVRQDYDAVHLTESGFLALKTRLPDWDCESTVWFNWKFHNVEDLGELPFVGELRCL